MNTISERGDPPPIGDMKIFTTCRVYAIISKNDDDVAVMMMVMVMMMMYE